MEGKDDFTRCDGCGGGKEARGEDLGIGVARACETQ